jgi:hypothetical protein
LQSPGFRVLGFADQTLFSAMFLQQDVMKKTLPSSPHGKCLCVQTFPGISFHLRHALSEAGF